MGSFSRDVARINVTVIDWLSQSLHPPLSLFETRLPDKSRCQKPSHPYVDQIERIGYGYCNRNP
jgi:hypothetical protein